MVQPEIMPNLMRRGRTVVAEAFAVAPYPMEDVQAVRCDTGKPRHRRIAEKNGAGFGGWLAQENVEVPTLVPCNFPEAARCV